MRSALVRIFALAALVGAALVGSTVGRAQSAPPPSGDVLPALLVEVRGLRAAIEQMASAGARVQLTLGRLQLQEQRINTMLRRLETVRGEGAAVSRDHDRLAEQLKALTDGVPDRSPEGRRQAELEIQAVKQELSRLGAALQKHVAEEAFLNQEIGGEQARWTEFNQRLEELERSLTRK
jgi:chromosome segregation ATPase